MAAAPRPRSPYGGAVNTERRDRLSTIWPLFGLRVRTPRLELRYPDDDDLAELADAAAAGVHDPATMPFLFAWTDVAPPQQQRNSVQHHWRNRADWRPDSWHCLLAVVVDGEAVGVQELFADSFATTGVVGSGSWLTRRVQGRGLGVEMRHAVLHLAFAGLGAHVAVSAAYEDNAASRAVSARLGYRPNGRHRRVRRGGAAWVHELLLDRDTWAAARRDDITVEGLAPCLELFGAPPALSDPTSR